MNRRRVAAGIALASLIAGVFVLSRGDEAKTRPAEVKTEARAEATTRTRGDAKAPTSKRATSAIDTREENPFKDKPRSLRGTDEDGALRVGPDGSLVLGPEVIRLFDYYFTTEGEEDEATIRARILAAIRSRVDGPAAIEAAKLLDEYLAYRKDEGGLELPKGAGDDPEARLAAISELRKKHFGEDAAEKLFGDEEREGEVAAASSKVRQDDSLTDEERERRVAELEEGLPAAAREAREASTVALRARDEAAAMRAEGASAEEIHAARAETLGEEAADRLAALDEARAAWKARVEAFRKERDALFASTEDEAARAKGEQALLDRSFTKVEQRRVRATLSMHP